MLGIDQGRWQDSSEPGFNFNLLKSNNIGWFFNWPPLPKSSKYKQVNLGGVRCILDDLRQRKFT